MTYPVMRLINKYPVELSEISIINIFFVHPKENLFPILAGLLTYSVSAAFPLQIDKSGKKNCKNT